MKQIVALTLCFVATLASELPAAEQTLPIRVTAGDIRVEFHPWNKGVQIYSGQTPVITGSAMIITTPPWSPHHYLGFDAADLKTATVEEVDGGQKVSIALHGQNDSFEGIEEYVIKETGVIKHSFKGKYTGDDEKALIEWWTAKINPTLIINRPYEVSLKNGSEKKGRVPVIPSPPEIEDKATIGYNFESVTFDSRIGPIRIDVDSDIAFKLYDFRKSRWAELNHPFFWFGIPGTHFDKAKQLVCNITYTIPLPPKADSAAESKTFSVETTDDPLAKVLPDASELTIIPKPKQVLLREGGYPIGPVPMAWTWTGSPTDLSAAAHAKASVQYGLAEMKRWGGYLVGKPQMIQPGEPVPDVGLVVTIDPKVNGGRAEGYELEVSPTKILVRAADANGCLYAIQTLKQMIVFGPDGSAVLQSVLIRDWPDLPFRGIHLFTGNKGADLHSDLIRKVISGLKMNTLVLQCEYINWDSQPKIHHPERGMSKKEAKRIYDVCQEQGLELIPLVMSLGHAQWLFTNEQNLDICEDPSAKWAYCVTNPRTYEVLFKIYEETIELFHPRVFHIGHDEFDHRGEYPHREESKKYTVHELFKMDTMKLYTWLKERGIQTMMWGDMMLGPGEVPDAGHGHTAEKSLEVRTWLPKDIIVADWHYVAAAPEKYTSLELFHDAGLQTIACTWDRPGNIINFASAAGDKDSLGLMQTTWAGYTLEPDSFQASIDQYCAYVLAAEAAWNAFTPPDPDTFPWRWHFFDLMGMSTLKADQAPGWLTDLSGLFNETLTAADADDWFGLGPAYDLSCVPKGRQQLKGIAFNLGQEGDNALVLAGQMAVRENYPEAVKLELNRKADRLIVLHTANFRTIKGAEIGSYTLEFEDGTTHRLPVRYGHDIFAYEDLGASPEAPAVWLGKNKAGQPVALRALIIANPNPKSVIRSIEFRSNNGMVSPIILGVTGLNDPRSSVQ